MDAVNTQRDLHGVPIKALYGAAIGKYGSLYYTLPKVKDKIQDVLLMMHISDKPDGVKVMTWFLNNLWWKMNEAEYKDARWCSSLDSLLIDEHDDNRDTERLIYDGFLIEDTYYGVSDYIEYAEKLLDRRELNILAMVLYGHSYKHISNVVGVSFQRVHQIVKGIRTKLDN